MQLTYANQRQPSFQYFSEAAKSRDGELQPAATQLQIQPCHGCQHVPALANSSGTCRRELPCQQNMSRLGDRLPRWRRTAEDGGDFLMGFALKKCSATLCECSARKEHAAVQVPANEETCTISHRFRSWGPFAKDAGSRRVVPQCLKARLGRAAFLCLQLPI